MTYLQRFDNPKDEELQIFCTRNLLDETSVQASVEEILATVKREGDSALLRYSKEFDGVTLSSLTVSEEEIYAAVATVNVELKEAIIKAKTNIHTFHEAQRGEGEFVEVESGIEIGRAHV